MEDPGGGGGHPDPEIRRGRSFFRLFRPQFGPKMRGGGGPPLDPSLERVMTQGGNLRALTGIFEFQLVVFRGCNLGLISGISANFNRLFEKSSGPSASKEKMQTV